MKNLIIILIFFVFSQGFCSSSTGGDFGTLRYNQKKEIWKDLEGCSFYKLESSSELCRLITHYNQIEKSDKKNAPERIRLLKEIAQLSKEGEALSLRVIHQTANNKAYYLEKILGLRGKALERSFRIVDAPQGKRIARGVIPNPRDKYQSVAQDL